MTYLQNPDKGRIETSRLRLRPFELEDAAFILELVNEPAFLQFIGDRGVRDLASARRYLTDGPIASYAKNGFGLLRVELRQSGNPIGMCGLIKRPALPEVDIGYAFIEKSWGAGYATEAAQAVLWQARQALGLKRVVAIVLPDNRASRRVLHKIGFTFEKSIRLGEGEPEVMLFGSG